MILLQSVCHSTGNLTVEWDNEEAKYLAFLFVIHGNVLHHSSSEPLCREWDWIWWLF